MPSSIEDKCEEYIEAYTDMIIQLVIKDFTPQQICAEKMCENVAVEAGFLFCILLCEYWPRSDQITEQ